ncbi:MAG: LuxR C-terminal-related transcriptional regulator [Chitinophagales bacterium]
MKKKDILSATETTILKLFAQGYKSPEVAKLRFNSKKTITTHRNSILAKLNVRSITAAVVSACQLGILQYQTIQLIPRSPKQSKPKKQ